MNHLLYKVREIELKNKNQTIKRLIIEFEDSACAILAEYLMVDAPLLNWKVINEMDAVLNERKKETQLSGNRTLITVNNLETKIEDLLAGMVDESDKLPTVVIETDAFHHILINWYETLSKFKKKQ